MERLRNYSACYYTNFENNMRIWECKHDIDTFENAEIFLEGKRYPFVIARNYNYVPESVKNFNARIAILKEMHEYNIRNFFKKDQIIVRK